MSQANPSAADLNTLTDEQLAAPGLLEAFIEDFQERGRRAVVYKTQRDEATTIAKTEHFNKKLSRNNEAAADVLKAIELCTNAREKVSK